MKYFACLVLVSLVFFLTAPGWSENPTVETEKHALVATLKAMWAAIEAGDAEKYGGYLHPDFTAFGENDAYLAEGKELELRNIRTWLQHARNVHTEMHHPNVTLRGAVAWITYYWTDSGSDQGKPFSSRGKSTRIFVKEKDQWLCIHAHHTLAP